MIPLILVIIISQIYNGFNETKLSILRKIYLELIFEFCTNFLGRHFIQILFVQQNLSQGTTNPFLQRNLFRCPAAKLIIQLTFFPLHSYYHGKPCTFATYIADITGLLTSTPGRVFHSLRHSVSLLYVWNSLV